jgi:hypothetical protein
MTTTRRAPQTYTEPIKYKVGEDISAERWQEIVLAVADWFAQTRTTKEPVLAAKQALQECLDGRTKEGQKWFAMARSSLELRIRSKCRFDITHMKPLRTAREVKEGRAAGVRERMKKAAEQKKVDPFLADERRRELQSDVVYGDDPLTHLSSREHENWKALKDDYIQNFPEELGTMAAKGELDTLCDLHIMNERNRMRLLAGHAVDPKAMGAVVDQIDKLKTILGIHPNQIAKRVKSRSDTTLGAAAARLETGEWRKIRQRFWAEEMIQLFQMYHTPTADGTDRQLNDVGLFGATRCRTCECTKCGTRNFVGIGIEEIEEYLVSQGHLVPEPTPEPVPEPESAGS